MHPLLVLAIAIAVVFLLIIRMKISAFPALIVAAMTVRAAVAGGSAGEGGAAGGGDFRVGVRTDRDRDRAGGADRAMPDGERGGR